MKRDKIFVNGAQNRVLTNSNGDLMFQGGWEHRMRYAFAQGRPPDLCGKVQYNGRCLGCEGECWDGMLDAFDVNEHAIIGPIPQGHPMYNKWCLNCDYEDGVRRLGRPRKRHKWRPSLTG